MHTPNLLLILLLILVLLLLLHLILLLLSLRLALPLPLPLLRLLLLHLHLLLLHLPLRLLRLLLLLRLPRGLPILLGRREPDNIVLESFPVPLDQLLLANRKLTESFEALDPATQPVQLQTAGDAAAPTAWQCVADPLRGQRRASEAMGEDVLEL